MDDSALPNYVDTVVPSAPLFAKQWNSRSPAPVKVFYGKFRVNVDHTISINCLRQNFRDTVIPRAAASLARDCQGWCGPGDLLLPARMKQQIPRAAETNLQSS